MKGIRHALSLAMLGLPAAIIPALAIELTADRSSRLAASEAVVNAMPDDHGAAARIEAGIEIAAPPAKVWGVMLDCSRSARFIRGLESCRIIEADPAGRWDVREHQVNWLSIMPRLRTVFRSQYETHRTISFSRVDGDVPILEGAWRLEPIKAGVATRLHYEVRIGLAGPVPDFIVRGAIENDLPRTLAALRQEVLLDARR